MKRRTGSIYNWFSINRNDHALFDLANGKSVEEVLMPLEIQAAAEGFNKRQIKALTIAVRLASAYVAAVNEQSTVKMRGTEFMAWLTQERIDSGVMTEAEAMGRFYHAVMLEWVPDK